MNLPSQSLSIQTSMSQSPEHLSFHSDVLLGEPLRLTVLEFRLYPSSVPNPSVPETAERREVMALVLL